MLKKANAIFILIFIILPFLPETAMATQAHGDPEGLYVHQFAHAYFSISLGIFIYWLRFRDLVKQTGWRYIQYAAFLLIFWNIDATIAHLLDEQLRIIEVEKIGNWHIKITSTDNTVFTIVLYYLVKLDHLTCVPALVFLFLGLREFVKDQPASFSEPVKKGTPKV